MSAFRPRVTLDSIQVFGHSHTVCWHETHKEPGFLADGDIQVGYSKESEQTEIELKEDNPHAVEGVLRYIYGCKIEDHGQKTWQYWLDLFETADKYLEPELSLEASIGFRMSALSVQKTDIEVICEILQTLQDTDRYGFFKSFAVGLTMRHLDLLDNKQFRAQVYSCKRVMFKMVKRLSFAVDLEPVELLCDAHGEQEIYQKDETGRCRIRRCMQ